MAIINAIIYAGNNIVASNSETNSSGGAEHLKKVIGLMADLLMPKDQGEKTKRAEQIKDILEREVNKGPLTVRPMARSVKQRGKVTLRRKDGTDSE